MRQGKTDRSGKAAILEKDELKELFHELDDPYRAIAEICYFAAGRINEVVSLEWGHIKNGSVVFPCRNTKTKESRYVKISAPLQQTLDRLERRHGYLFPSASQSGHITARAFENKLKLASGILGYTGVSTHSFRRSRLTHKHEEGWGLHELRRLSGHKNLAQLQEYLGVDQMAVDQKLMLEDAAW